MTRGGSIRVSDLSPAFQRTALNVYAGVMEGEKVIRSRRKAKGAQLPKESEDEFNIVVVNFLTNVLPVGGWFCHIPNEGKRTKAAGAKLKAKGMKPGAGDLLVIYLGRAFWLELKADDGVVSTAQRICHADLIRAGSPVEVVSSLTEVETALRGWGIPLRGTAQGFLR